MTVTRNGKPFDHGEIHSDADDQPDTLAVGDVKLILLKRGERLAIRLKDNQSPFRASFAGLRWFPVREDWRIQAKFVAYPTPTKLVMDTIVGETDELESPGYVTFEREGKDYQLQAAGREGRLALVRLPRRHQRADNRRRCPAALRRCPQGRPGRARLQQGGQPPVLLHSLRHLPAGASAEPAEPGDRGRRAQVRAGSTRTLGPVSQAAEV